MKSITIGFLLTLLLPEIPHHHNSYRVTYGHGVKYSTITCCGPLQVRTAGEHIESENCNQI